MKEGIVHSRSCLPGLHFTSLYLNQKKPVSSAAIVHKATVNQISRGRASRPLDTDCQGRARGEIESLVEWVHSSNLCRQG